MLAETNPPPPNCAIASTTQFPDSRAREVEGADSNELDGDVAFGAPGIHVDPLGVSPDGCQQNQSDHDNGDQGKMRFARMAWRYSGLERCRIADLREG